MPKTCLLGLLDHSQEGLEPVLGPSQGPQLGPRSGCLLPDPLMGKISGFIGRWCWTSVPTESHLSMDGCQIVGGGGDTNKGRLLIQPYCSCQLLSSNRSTYCYKFPSQYCFGCIPEILLCLVFIFVPFSFFLIPLSLCLSPMDV